jgi:branched-chain amino acid aminotransferase
MMRSWNQGQIIEGAAMVNADDRGFLLGDGLFETILVRDGFAIWLDDHLERMRSGASLIGLEFPEVLITHAVRQMVDGQSGFSTLRIAMSRGSTERHLAADGGAPTLQVTMTGFDEALMFQPARLITARTRRNEGSALSQCKSLSYLDQILVAREAKAKGADDGLMLNTKGQVACTSIANVFVLHGNKLITPSCDQGVLAGIARGMVLRLAGAARFSIEERAVAPQELNVADAVFLTNSLRLLRPVTVLDGQSLALGAEQPLADLLRQAAGLGR